ncbi:ABC transporter ATP-binding protein [Spiroplasma endosymbiont of Aspidapion aeneum]|uniref:ABC transporter ATP-binding protein n=1 Tax=Spiroplasma endosymbiont of Aspidapion aeneum TaxID=3066276 RepID=UPI00313D31F4
MENAFGIDENLGEDISYVFDKKTRKDEKVLSNLTSVAYKNMNSYYRKRSKVLKLNLNKIGSFKMFLVNLKFRPFLSLSLLLFCFFYSIVVISCVYMVWKITSLIFANHLVAGFTQDIETINKIWKDVQKKGGSTGNLNPARVATYLSILQASKEDTINSLLAPYYGGSIKYSNTIAESYLSLFNLKMTISYCVTVLFALIGILFVIASIRSAISFHMGEKIERDIKLLLSNKLIFHDYDFYISYSSALLIDIYKHGPSNIVEFIKVQQTTIFNIIVTVPSVIMVMLFIDQKMTLIVTVSSLLYSVLSVIAFSIIFKVSKKREKLHLADNISFSERIMANRLIKSSGTWEYEYHKMFLKTGKTQRGEYLLAFREAFQQPLLIGFIMFLIFMPFIAGAIAHNGDPSILINTLPAFIVCSFIMISCLFPFQLSSQLEKKAKISITKINDLLSNKIIIDKHQFDNAGFPGLNDCIEFNSVSFSYPNNPDQPVFENLNFRIDVGDKVGLIGESGCGKTTIVKLLLGFYRINSGQILIDGIPLENYSLNSWLDQISFIDQSPQLFSISILENVRYGMPDKTIEEVVNACKMANIHEFIMSTPDKYDTVLEDGGERLSGGQRQMLTFARLFLKDSGIIIIDEGTANMDPSTEKKVMTAFQKLIEHKTVVSISHKISLLKLFNKILVMSPKIGIIQEGSFESLEENIGYFNYLNNDDD